jgi:hypothetical protein
VWIAWEVEETEGTALRQAQGPEETALRQAQGPEEMEETKDIEEMTGLTVFLF